MAFVVAATWIAKEGHEQRVLDAIVTMTPLSRAEEGCLVYQPQVDAGDPRTFFLYEQYVDQAAFDAHRASPHFQEHVVNGVLEHLEERSAKTFLTIDV